MASWFVIPAQLLASSPGLMSTMESQRPTSRAKDSKQRMFPGFYPNPGMLSAEKIRYETPAKAAQEAATTTAKRQVEQAMPNPAWMTYTDPKTRRQQKRWSGAQAQVDLGAPPEKGLTPSFSDYASARKAVQNYYMPPGPLGEVKRLDKNAQQDYYSALRRFLAGETGGLSPTQAYLSAIDQSYAPQSPTTSIKQAGQAPAKQSAGRDPRVAARIKSLLEQGHSAVWIRSKLQQAGIDPMLYGELNQ
jgi:hypothetical protein